MISFPRKNIVYTFWDLAFFLVAVALFLPVFLSVFSAHTDGYFILTKKGSWLGDIEGSIMFMQGRPLGALTNSVLGWFIYKAEDLTWLRIAAFVLTLISSRLIYLIAKRENVEVIWSYWLAFYFILLPSNVLHVVWVANGIPESLGVLFGIASYFFLYYSNVKFLSFRLVLAAICFLIGLLMYQPMAMIVFALIVIKVFWSTPENWSFIRIKIFQEILFYCSLMAIYWMLIKLLVIPLGHALGLIPTTFAMYKMELSSSITDKLPLVLDTLLYGFIGGWDPLLHTHPSLELLLMVVCLVAGSGIIFLFKCKNFLQASLLGRFFQKLLFLSVLFFCANAPSSMAVNCKAVLGYRTLLPASFMGLLLISYFFRYCCSVFTNGLDRIITNNLIVIYSIAALMAGSWTINQNVFNNLKTYLYVDALAKRIDYSKIEKIYLRHSSLVWFSYPLPFEMGYFPANLDYIFYKYGSLKGRSVQVCETFTDWPLFLDNYTKVIDFEFLSNKSLLDDKKVYLYATSRAQQKILFFQDFSNMRMYPTLELKQKMDDGRLLSDWNIPSTIQKGFIYVHFIGPQESLFSYAINIDCRNAQGQSSFFELKWQGLDKHKKWVDVTGLTSCLGRTKLVQIVHSSVFSYLRLVIIKRMSSDTLIIKELQFISQ